MAWPFVVRAQQAAIPVVGFLNAGSANPNAHLVAAFRQGLTETGGLSPNSNTIGIVAVAALAASAAELAGAAITVT